MKKLTTSHSEAVSMAKSHMIRLLDRDAAPRWKQHIEKQIDLLTEVYWYVLNGIFNPDLPFDEKKINGSSELKGKPRDNGTAAKKD